MGHESERTMRRRRVRQQIAKAERRLAVLREELATLGEASSPSKPRPVACGKTRFPSTKAAARAVGVTPAAIPYRIRRGIGGWRYADDDGEVPS